MSKVLIIDSHSLGHRAKFSMSGLSYRDQETGVVFGFLNDILTLADKFKTNKFIFAWDSSESKRKELFSGYKNRNGDNLTPAEIELNLLAREQFKLLRYEILPTFGFKNIFGQLGYEADDVIASLVLDRESCLDPKKTIVVSRDNDLFQLLKFCSMYDIQLKKLLDEETFTLRWGIPPGMWAEVKCLSGCNADTVPNIPGVKELTAIKYLKGELKETTAAFKRIESEEGKNIIERNRKLVELPFEDVKIFKPDFDEKFSYKGFMDICKEYGLASFIVSEKFDKWKKLFQLVER